MTVSAGDFAAWLERTREARTERSGVDVPCGPCTACCRSSYFVHIGPDEKKTLARIPKPLLFPAPGRPQGHVLMGFDENGHCPMLVNDKCTIYADRPLTCRTYDCRVFPATGVSVDEENRPDITRQAQRWEFAYSSDADRTTHDAVREAAKFLRQHADAFGGAVPKNATQLAVLAVTVYDVFARHDAESAKTGNAKPSAELIRAVTEANERWS